MTLLNGDSRIWKYIATALATLLLTGASLIVYGNEKLDARLDTHCASQSSHPDIRERINWTHADLQQLKTDIREIRKLQENILLELNRRTP